MSIPHIHCQKHPLHDNSTELGQEPFSLLSRLRFRTPVVRLSLPKPLHLFVHNNELDGNLPYPGIKENPGGNAQFLSIVGKNLDDG